jgi:hypothetical protein
MSVRHFKNNYNNRKDNRKEETYDAANVTGERGISNDPESILNVFVDSSNNG